MQSRHNQVRSGLCTRELSRVSRCLSLSALGLGLENELQIAPLKCLTARVSQIARQGLRRGTRCLQSDLLIVLCAHTSRLSALHRAPRLRPPPSSSPASAAHHWHLALQGLVAGLVLPAVHSLTRVTDRQLIRPLLVRQASLKPCARA